MKQSSRIVKKEKGHSLLEVIVVLGITGIIALITAGLLGTQTEIFSMVFSRSMLNSEGRLALNRLRIDLHNMSPDSVSVMQSDQLVFTDTEGNSIAYQYVNNEIQRNSVSILRHVQSPPFVYLDTALVVTADPADLAFVRINLDLSLNGKTVQLEELIYARN
ncbi:MAG: hypothetical protein Kow0042_14590 [Calditrichia bacterium]